MSVSSAYSSLVASRFHGCPSARVIRSSAVIQEDDQEVRRERASLSDARSLPSFLRSALSLLNLEE
eukprot:6942091-Heterocapsa_arctica.AAC.1